jgi:hypothetical protein
MTPLYSISNTFPLYFFLSLGVVKTLQFNNFLKKRNQRNHDFAARSNLVNQYKTKKYDLLTEYFFF